MISVYSDLNVDEEPGVVHESLSWQEELQACQQVFGHRLLGPVRFTEDGGFRDVSLRFPDAIWIPLWACTALASPGRCTSQIKVEYVRMA